ncbi:MAG: carbonic anhydrase family protein, partial [Candidatus Accumulibacter sp.]|nr:carbonic anhydrase family protein [Accumulibacter sp.]
MNPDQPAKILATILAATLPAAVSAAWQTIDTEQGRHIEIDRESIVPGPGGTLTAKGRIVLDKPIVDPRTSTSYNIIEIESRYDCAERTRVTLKRTYYKEDNTLLRHDEVQGSFELPVRSSTPDGVLLREVCRPSDGAAARPSLNETLGKVNELAADLRKSNEALVAQAVQRDAQRTPRPSAANSSPPASRRAPAAARRGSQPSWAYEGASGPAHWSELNRDYAVCATGRRQSPIDLRDAFAVDLEPIQFL